MKRFLAASLFLFSMLASVYALESGPAPDFTLKKLNGEPLSLSALKGKVVIVDFWATWCPPCRAEIPGFVELYKKYKDRGLEIVGISVDKDAGKLKKFVEENGVSYPVVSFTQEVTEAYGGIQSIPTTFVIDRNMNIVAKHIGFTDTATFEKEIEPLLQAEASAEPMKSEVTNSHASDTSIASETATTSASVIASETPENTAPVSAASAPAN